MKVLMVSDSLGRGGSERRLVELLKGLKKADNIEAELLVFSKKIEFEELEVYKIPTHIIERKPKKDPRGFFKFYRLCKKINPDIIHSWGSMSTIYALPARWWQDVKLINAMITDAPVMSLFNQRRLRFRCTSPHSDLILANSQAGLDAYNAPKSKSAYVYNGYDFDRSKNLMDKKAVRAKYSIPELSAIGMVGAFAPRKDYFTFISIANRILAERKDVVFIAVGDGVLFHECQQRVDPKSRDRFIFTGRISDTENVIRLFDIGILISNPEVHGEGISNAIMEYMAAGIPVIANDNGGNAEIISNNNTGYLMPGRKVSNWVERINYLLDNPEVAKRMGAAGYQRVQDQFNIRNMVDRYIEIYTDLLRKKSIGHQS